ncbi:DUF2982 domain-containing protein [Vibrio aestuarianus]|uniref:DUF2982 domain-containing protein n=1 Tax=Vibrio aestuarianus TaxID=28171 RepID=UPI001447CBFC|nr:DUF2982 domain-containing protein [Vibrio aestuarianus]MDE1212968.1 DUF2982 domain-containing protein [Vibrio aestuarianus]MDE1216786.1 DUF2982 domain-containing protein [Vibrio aestuarianus]MDE1260096.1 DUF2982 domain-containing protein [Vibrio aestuarianus]MDE1267122.1 DUF2982 domain-containing protein [Vibrio aestuarianus]MDE1274318.1 DUF2982 domain-containing protein [Vibrio aestuarianus]
MQTLHLTNTQFHLQSPYVKWCNYICVIIAIFLLVYAPSLTHALLFIILLISLVAMVYFLILKGKVSYTLTPTHFQQHLFKGGWVVKWHNVQNIGICNYDNQGWHQSLPWIGIKLKDYEPYLDSICPRIASEILLSQRSLLYLGAKQKGQETRFEEIVLDSAIFTASGGKSYHGLLAMLANRMRYQRQYFDYDIFISVQDLERDAESFVGLARRYLAAAEPE